MGTIRLGRDDRGRENRPTVYGRSVEETQAKLDRLIAAHKRGEYNRPSKDTLAAYVEQWLDEVHCPPKILASTHALYKSTFQNHMKVRLGNTRLDRFSSPEHVERLYGGLRSDGRSERIVKQVHVILNAALKHAVKRGRIFRNPVALIDSVPEYKAPERPFLTPQDAEKLLTKSDSDPLRALYYVALDTGARQGELFALRRADIDLQDRTISIRRSVRYDGKGEPIFTQTKNKKSRCVPISARTTAALKTHLKKNMGSEYVFSSENGQPLRKENFLRRSFHKLRERAGLATTVHFHDLRHACATRLLSQGVHPKVVAERLGHASTDQTLETYSHVVPGLQREAADLFDRVAPA